MLRRIRSLMTDLSPAALAVLDAFGTYPLRVDHIDEDLVPALAAALRAAADQVPDHQMSAHMLYAIAAELDNHQHTIAPD
jgi:hypothetical protein